LINDIVSPPASHDDSAPAKKAVPRSKLQELVKLMIADVGSPERALLGEQIGTYNRKFAQKWQKYLTDKFGAEGQLVTDAKKLQTLIHQVH
jgi:hypothetical protein